MVQIALNTLILAALYIPMGISFYFAYKVTRTIDFTVAIYILSGAYMGYYFHIVLSYSLMVSVLFSFLLTGLLCVFLEALVLRRLRLSNPSILRIVLVSIACYIVFQNSIILCFGASTKSLRSWPPQKGITIFDANITTNQVLIIVLSFIVMIVGAIFLHYTKVGKIIRAVTESTVLSSLAGINVNRIIFLVNFLIALVAAYSGILQSIDNDINPIIGIQYLMISVVAVTIGGIDNYFGILAGSIILAIVQNLTGWFLSSEWIEATTFLILVTFLLIKPEGILGSRSRKVSI